MGIMLRRKKKVTCVYKWIKRFRDGREAVEDDEGRGRQTSSKIFENVDAIRNLVDKDSKVDSLSDSSDYENIRCFSSFQSA